MSMILGNNVIAAATGGTLYLSGREWLGVGSDTLLKSPASIIADYIIDALGLMTRHSDDSAWPLFVASMPDTIDIPTDCGAVFDTSGIIDLRQMNGYSSQHPGIQIKIRSQNYDVGYAKIEALANALDVLRQVTTVIGVETFAIYNVSRTSPIVSLGKELGTKRRFLFTINFLVTIKNVTS